MDYFTFYSKYFHNLKEVPIKQNVICVFHEDKSPSLSLDLSNGLFYCHSCKEGGDIFTFYMKHHNVNFKRAKQEILGKRDAPILSMANVYEAHNRLKNNKTIKAMLWVTRNWDEKTIEKLLLGWEEERVTIPIFDAEKNLTNIRKYDVLHKSKDKFKGVPGFNDITLYPFENIIKDPIIIFAGEPDTILANQYDLPAITFTGGEGSFNPKLIPSFKNKVVYICYDTDEGGKRGAKILANKLSSVVKQIKILNLPQDLLGENKNDFTDLVLRCATEKWDFNKIWNNIVDGAEIFTIEEQKPDDYKDYLEINFHNAIDPKYYGKNIHFRALAIGSAMSPYFVPRKIKLKCSTSKGDGCKACALFFTGGEFQYLVPDEYAIELINTDSQTQKKKLREIAGIGKCNIFDVVIEEVETVEALWLSPIIEKERIEQKFISRKSYMTSYGITTNKVYDFYGKTLADPEDQTAIHWLTKADSVIADLYDFELSDDDIEALKIFQAEDETQDSVELKFLEIEDDINYNGPESAIVQREDLMIAFDLIYHTALRFKFLHNEITKGWGECLILGDTGTGKTVLARKFMQHYRAGEYITLEKATTSGIVGGISKVGNSSIFTWGIFPINDGRLVILDEVNGLDQNAIGDLSAIRSTGIAERTVVGSTRRTSARVRTVWISNPRSNARAIRYYSSGVEAIRELIGRPEDIQRFDFAIIVGADEVPSTIVNSANRKFIPNKFTPELCNKLLTWVWSRKINNIKFDHEAEKLILKIAIDMGEKYSDNIPLVQATTQRIKLARLSVAAAARTFSTKDGKDIIIRPCHVEFIRSYLDRIYNTPNFNYGDWSILKTREGELNDKMDIVKKLIYQLQDPLTFCSKILDTRDISMSDLEDFTNYIEREKTKYLRTELVQNNCIKRVGNFYRKTPEFTNFVKVMVKTLRARKDENKNA